MSSLPFFLQVVWAFLLLAVLLGGMVYIGGAVQRGRLVIGAKRRLISTVETTVLAQNVGVHVVKIGTKYFVLGGGTAGISLIAELPASDVEPYIESQRATLEAQRASIVALFGRRKRS